MASKSMETMKGAVKVMMQRKRKNLRRAIGRAQKAVDAIRAMETIIGMATVAIVAYYPTSPSERNDPEAKRAVKEMRSMRTSAKKVVTALKNTSAACNWEAMTAARVKELKEEIMGLLTRAEQVEEAARVQRSSADDVLDLNQKFSVRLWT